MFEFAKDSPQIDQPQTIGVQPKEYMACGISEPKPAEDFKLRDSERYHDANGDAYDGSELLGTVSFMQKLGLSREYIDKLTPMYIATAHKLEININGLGGLVLLAVMSSKKFPELEPMSRRTFILVGGIIVLGIITGGIYAYTINRLHEIEDVANKCKALISPSVDAVQPPKTDAEFKKIENNPHAEADALLNGAYNSAWVNSQKGLMAMTEEALLSSLVPSFGSLMRETIDDPEKRVRFVATKSEFQRVLMDDFKFPEDEARYRADHSLGLAVLNGESQLALINIELITNKIRNPVNANAEIVRATSDTIIHEQAHNVKQVSYSTENKQVLLQIFNEMHLSGSTDIKAVEIIDGETGLTIKFRCDDGSVKYLLGSNQGSMYPCMEEVIREFSQRIYRRRLDLILKKDKPSRIDTSYLPAYVGYECLLYLFDRIGVNVEQSADLLNDIRTRKSNKNIVDLLNLMVSAGRRREHIAATPEAMFLALWAIEKGVVQGMKKLTKINTVGDRVPSGQMAADYFCGLSDSMEVIKQEIDQWITLP